jgi:hypothetical protein|tara:strand:- start:3319 stop:3963 length:645 start_codon:yes stop_codon:yes gene_type:complete
MTSNPHKEEKQRFDELFRRVQFTCKARYNAARRLKTYHLFSQITPAFISIGLVVIPLAKMLGFNKGYSPEYVDLMQIVFAVALLAYSLLLGIGDFSARAERMHACGMDLGRIARKLFPYRSESDSKDLDTVYDSISNDYYECLEKYENHTHIDFLSAKYDLLDSGEKFNPEVEARRAALWVNKSLRELFTLSHFLFSLAAIGFWVYFMIQYKSC